MSFQQRNRHPNFSPEAIKRIQDASRQEEQVIWRGLAQRLTQCFQKVTNKRITIVGKMARGGRYRVVDWDNNDFALKYQDCVLTETHFGIFRLITEEELESPPGPAPYTYADYQAGIKQAWRRDGKEVTVWRTDGLDSRRFPLAYLNPITNRTTVVNRVGRAIADQREKYDTINDLFRVNPNGHQ